MAKKSNDKQSQSKKKQNSFVENSLRYVPEEFSLQSEIKKSKKSIDSEDFEPPSVSKDEINNLKKLLTTKEIEIASGDLASHVQSDEITKDLIGKKTGTYYHDIIFALVQIRLPEEEAERDWDEILKHKQKIGKRLKRNVGIHVATLDYYINIKRRVFNPTIIDANEFADTASRAITDELTRAYNRHFFEGELKRLFTFAKLFNKSFSLLLFDLDHFKAYNDINGHIKGDIALIQTVNIFHAVCGSNATVCRYGGEEFTVILPNCELQEAVRTADNVRKALYDFRFVNEQHLPGERLSVSCGVTSFRKDIKKPSEIIEEADIALYRAKRAGRNKIKTFLKQE